MTPLWADLAGIIAAVLSTSSGLTQLGRLLRARTALGIATGTWILTTMSTVTWFGYAISLHSPVQEFANGSWMFFVLVLTSMMLRSRGQVAQVVGVVAVFASLALFTALGSISTAIPGTCGIIASLLMSLPQIRYAVRHGRGPGVSVLGWALGALAAAMWFVYGVGTRQIPVFINTGIQTVLLVAVVIALIANPTHTTSEREYDPAQ
ncbi:MAG: hypothetical protein F2520_12190 [Actinobacteria bacterium]|uniref:Unannotated protein n=1 Tax=freshwater metagenome TaxID=449393 RepID=A0A6J5YGY4_9ZZZZ|nr:hypothetical protein [Actinomycetota bacterium]MTA79010.1 hypothetical protein [Actinomycetota bacterium]